MVTMIATSMMAMDVPMMLKDKKVIIIANHVFLSGASFKNKAPRKAESIGAIATIIRVLATLVF